MLRSEVAPALVDPVRAQRVGHGRRASSGAGPSFEWTIFSQPGSAFQSSVTSWSSKIMNEGRWARTRRVPGCAPRLLVQRRVFGVVGGVDASPCRRRLGCSSWYVPRPAGPGDGRRCGRPGRARCRRRGISSSVTGTCHSSSFCTRSLNREGRPLRAGQRRASGADGSLRRGTNSACRRARCGHARSVVDVHGDGCFRERSSAEAGPWRRRRASQAGVAPAEAPGPGAERDGRRCSRGSGPGGTDAEAVHGERRTHASRPRRRRRSGRRCAGRTAASPAQFRFRAATQRRTPSSMSGPGTCVLGVMVARPLAAGAMGEAEAHRLAAAPCGRRAMGALERALQLPEARAAGRAGTRPRVKSVLGDGQGTGGRAAAPGRPCTGTRCRPSSPSRQTSA